MITTDTMSHDEMKQKMKRGYLCGECGASLSVAWGGYYGVNSYILRCTNNVEHNGLAREAKLPRMDTPDEYQIGNLQRIRSKKLITELGEQKGTALVKYAGKGQLAIQEATEIITTIWPGAPAVEVKKAAMVCQIYGLNPLMKHLYLIPFAKREKRGNEWVTVSTEYSMVLGIKASRIIARRRGEYAYLDDTPRIMTDAEQIKIFGEVDQVNICAITRLNDRKGNSAIGTGKWPKATEVKGGDKGNSKLNMAMIRSERQALERLFPDSMPSDVPDVVDERFQDLDDGRKVDTSTGEIKEPAVEGEYTEQTEGQEQGQDVKPARDPASIKNKGDLFAACCKDWPEKFAIKADVLRFMGKEESQIADASLEYSQIAAKLKQ